MSRKDKTNKLSNILSNLPLHHKLHQQLSTSEKIISIVQPHWQQWCLTHLGKPLSSGCMLSHFSEGTLHISCQSANAATKLKRLKHTLLLFFQRTAEQPTNQSTQTLFEKITDVSIMHEPQAQQNALKKLPRSMPVSASAISAIESYQKHNNNTDLQNALGRLKNTLKHYKP